MRPKFREENLLLLDGIEIQAEAVIIVLAEKI
jgi:hypothetical protein